MPILKVKSKKGVPEETKLVGVRLPRQVSHYLTLFSLAHGITMTIVIRNETQHWYDSQMETEADLVKLIAKKARVEQKKWKSEGSFKKSLRADLKRREIDDKHISVILTALE